MNSPPVSVLVKSIRMGLAMSNNCLSTKKVKPLLSKTSSSSCGSSRAIARQGVPHPPAETIILTGEVCFLVCKNSVTISLASSETSNIANALKLIQDCG